MYKKVIGIILSSMLLLLPGCGSTSITKSYMREGTSLAYIKTVAVLPFEGGGEARRIREFTMTQLLASGLFDVVDKGRVDNLLRQEALKENTPLNAATIRRLGQQLKVQAFILGSVEEESKSRGSASFPEVTMTLRLIDCETGKLLWQASGRGSGYSWTDRLFGMAPKDSFQVTMKLLNDLFATMS
ncbi:MAG: CsgG/HfaB family protein [Deltaproteobacteria bacterium]|jgi:TolB-like protein